MAVIGTLACCSAPAAGASPTATVSGEVVAASFGSITVKTGAADTGAIDAMVSYADRLGAEDLPYVYGGGHAHAGEASTDGHGHTAGYDCSGAVAAVLAAGGLWPHHSAVPSDVGIIQELAARKLITRGPGSGPDAVTLYDVPGHIEMSLAGALYGTGGDRKGGPDWLYGSVGSLHGVSVWHYKSSLFTRDPAVPDEVRLQAGSSTASELMADGIGTGERIDLTYAPSTTGTLTLTGVTYPHAITVSATVSEISSSGGSLDLLTSAGTTLKLVAPPWPYSGGFGLHVPPTLTGDLYIGDTVTALYTSLAAAGHTPAELVVHVLKVTATPPHETVTGTITSKATNGRSFTLRTTSGQTLNLVFRPQDLPEGLDPLDGVPDGSTVEVDCIAAPDGLALTVLKYAVDAS